MESTLIALGRGVVKLLISLFVGSGIGLLTFGITTRDEINLWNRPYPPSGFFIALGAGLLSTALMMVVLFIIPRIVLKTAGTGTKSEPYHELPR